MRRSSILFFIEMSKTQFTTLKLLQLYCKLCYLLFLQNIFDFSCFYLRIFLENNSDEVKLWCFGLYASIKGLIQVRLAIFILRHFLMLQQFVRTTFQMQSIADYTLCQSTSKAKSGSYGVVRKAVNAKNGKIYALKLLKAGITSQGISPTVIREITILKQLNPHPNIISLRQPLLNSGYFYLVFDFVQFNLRQFLFSVKVTSEVVKKFLYQILNAMSFAHSKRIMHRDLKPENILVHLDRQKEVVELKVADWGLSRVFDQSKQCYTLQVASLPYRAPQIFLGMRQYTQAIDIWSIGCIFAEMLSGSRLFSGSSQTQYLLDIFKTLDIPTRSEWPLGQKLIDYKSLNENLGTRSCLRERVPQASQSALDLLKSMLQVNFSKRITASNALKHPYFQQQH